MSVVSVVCCQVEVLQWADSSSGGVPENYLNTSTIRRPMFTRRVDHKKNNCELQNGKHIEAADPELL
jgi:hypothetical protein